MNRKKVLFSAIFSLVFFGFLGAGSAHATTAEELQALIDQLLAQVARLQEQARELERESAPADFCYDFTNALRGGSTGEEVKAVQTALGKEGLFDADATGYFGPLTFAAVVKFQEKYQEEILTPFDITKGTGFVGTTTRVKLNTLYGCAGKTTPPVLEPEPTAPSEPDAGDEPTSGEPASEEPGDLMVGPAPLEPPAPQEPVPPSLVVLSPNGGEQWDVGKSYPITWESQSVSAVDIFLYKGSDVERTIVSGYGDAGTYDWTVPVGIQTGSDYTVRVVNADDASLSDASDEAWTIKVDATPPTPFNGMPTGVLLAGTSETALSLETNEKATCRYGTKIATDYYSMIFTFASANSTFHETPLTGLRDGNAYNYYVKCLDPAGNRNFLDFKISFEVGR